MSTGGSLLAVQIDSVSYIPDGEADLSEKPPKEIEARASAGETFYKVMKKVPEIEGFDLIVDSVEKQTLTDLLGIVVAVSYTEADGTVNSGQAMFNIDSRSTMENKMSLTMLPQGKFSVFPP